METVFEINEEQRRELAFPPCRVFETKENFLEFVNEVKPKVVTCVGDVVSDLLNGLWKNAVIDNKTLRKPYRRKEAIEADIKLRALNPAGRVTKSAWEAMKKCFCFSCSCVLEIKGEEDLLGLPALYFSPKNSLVVFGLRNEGIGCFYTEEIHREFVKKFIALEREENVIVGGTFACFHAGHRYLLLTAFETGEKVFLGISSDEFARKLKNYVFPSFEERAGRIENFLRDFGFEKRCEIIKLDDSVGISADIERGCMVVTKDLEEKVKEINRIRERKGLEKLKVVVIEKLSARDGKPISCKRIAKGEINENGIPSRIRGKKGLLF